MHYCYVCGGERKLNFHGWLSDITIERLRNEGCTVEIWEIQNNPIERVIYGKLHD